LKRAKPLLWPALVAALTLGVTAWLWQHERQTQGEMVQRQFDFGVRQTAARIGERITAYEQMLRGVRGLFDASDKVTAADFAGYVDALLSGADIAGLRSIAWLPLQAGAAAPVGFVAPTADPPLLSQGDDVLADPVRRKVLLAARDSGTVALSERLTGSATASDGGAASFLLCIAVYRREAARDTAAQRRANVAGWACASFRVGDLMSSLYGEGTPGLAVHLHDGTDDSEASHMYGVEMAANRLPSPNAREYLGIGGRSWTLVAHTTPEFVQRYGRDASVAVALAGVGLSLALALLTWQLVTARDRAAAAAHAMTRELRESAERYRRIVETADEGIWTVDAAGHTSFANPKLLQMLGCRADQLIGRPWTETMDDVGRRTMEGDALAALRRGERVQHDIRLRRSDGSDLWATMSVSPAVDEAGRHVGSLAMVTDVTERHRAEARRTQLEEQLRQSQKMEAIGTLAGGIAHDFNNLLAAILGNVAQLQQDLGPAHPQLARLDQIRQAATRGRSLVQQIVTFSRQQPHERRLLALRPLIEESARLLRATLPALVELELQLSDEPMRVIADATQLQQVLLNLCTNAWHSMTGGTGRIVIGLEPARLETPPGNGRSGRHARLWVADDGCGMDVATCERIFEPFFTTKPVGQGTGLGLAVVHGIVSSHDGVISVASTPGRGTRFDLLLPLDEATLPDETADRRPADAAPSGQGQHVLYVDDDPLMCVMVESLLQRAGYRVTTLEDPQLALARVVDAVDAAERVDLVVTDFNMPAMSGLALAKALHRALPDLPLIITSGFVNEGLPAQAREAGVAHLLQKEYTVEQLVPLVQRTLAGG